MACVDADEPDGAYLSIDGERCRPWLVYRSAGLSEEEVTATAARKRPRRLLEASSSTLSAYRAAATASAAVRESVPLLVVCASVGGQTMAWLPCRVSMAVRAMCPSTVA